jgi:pimeloyl-ACP methyl ester carboxylesterase
MMGSYLHSNGIRLHYLDYPGDGPTLILMHGLTANAHSFEGLIRAGVCPRVRVLSVGRRGRGVSATIPTTPTVSQIMSLISSA